MSLRGQMLCCRARRGRQPSWLLRWWVKTSTASVERWDFICEFHLFQGVTCCQTTNREPIRDNTPCLISQAVDVWAIGVTLYCFVFGKVSLQQDACTVRGIELKYVNCFILFCPASVPFLRWEHCFSAQQDQEQTSGVSRDVSKHLHRASNDYD